MGQQLLKMFTFSLLVNTIFCLIVLLYSVGRWSVSELSSLTSKIFNSQTLPGNIYVKSGK